MGFLGDIGSLIGGVTGGAGDQEKARQILAQLNAEAGPSAFSKIKEDPALRTDQLYSLAALKSIADNGGMRTEDKVAQRQAMDAADARTQMQTGAALQGAAARGMAGGPAELAARLNAQQAGAETNAVAGSNAAADASRRALAAIGQYGTMAGNVRGQDFNTAATTAGATDAMSRFNAGQRVTKAQDQAGLADRQGYRQQQTWQNFGNNIGNDVENTASAAYGKWGG